MTGVHERPDGRGFGLRFALRPQARGHGFAREAAGAALRFAHEQAGLARVVAVARETNFDSRTVLGAIGMRPADKFRARRRADGGVRKLYGDLPQSVNVSSRAEHSACPRMQNEPCQLHWPPDLASG